MGPNIAAFLAEVTLKFGKFFSGNRLNDFEIEVGAVDYGLDLDGIIGMDFIEQVKAVIDFGRLEIC